MPCQTKPCGIIPNGVQNYFTQFVGMIIVPILFSAVENVISKIVSRKTKLGTYLPTTPKLTYNIFYFATLYKKFHALYCWLFCLFSFSTIDT